MEPDKSGARQKKRQVLAAKCSKSRDLTAIAVCDLNRESQITSDLRRCGVGVRPRPPSRPLVTTLARFRLKVDVCVLAPLVCDIVCSFVMVLSCQAHVSLDVCVIRVGKVAEHSLLGYSASLFAIHVDTSAPRGRTLDGGTIWSLGIKR